MANPIQGPGGVGPRLPLQAPGYVQAGDATRSFKATLEGMLGDVQVLQDEEIRVTANDTCRTAYGMFSGQGGLVDDRRVVGNALLGLVDAARLVPFAEVHHALEARKMGAFMTLAQNTEHLLIGARLRLGFTMRPKIDTQLAV